MITETNIMSRIQNEKFSLPPAELRVVDVDPIAQDRLRVDAILEAKWDGQTTRFAAEVKSLSTPKVLSQAIAVAMNLQNFSDMYPMVIVPYLSPEKLEQLESAGISGLDLCGNGILTVPSRMLIFRSGQPNRFPQSVKFRNVYRSKNSLVARATLIKPRFDQVKDIVELLKRRGSDVSFSTVSKALKSLEEELIVSRNKKQIRLLQAETLLDNLVKNYEPPIIENRFVGKCDLPADQAILKLKEAANNLQGQLVMTGEMSVEKYAIMAREPVVSLYTSLPPSKLIAASKISVKETSRFANLEIRQTDDARVYFDPNPEDGLPYASPIQTYLELATGDKRQKDAAQQIRINILNSIDKLNDDNSR